MGIGVGITLLVVGLILVTGAVDVPDGVNDVVATDTVGWICVVVGALALVLAVLLTRQRSRSTRVVEEQRYDR
jgi:protein-S-isoprenylcysteine O-methyltransferase Ste14